MTQIAFPSPVHPWVAEAERRIRFGIVHPLLGSDLAWPEVNRCVQQAEALGFDSYWFSDHPLLNADCWTRIAALAATTRAIRLGTMVTCIYYRHPVLLARIVADIDRMSDGRVVLGVGMGDFAPEFAQLGLPFPPTPARQEALEEAIDIVRGVWGEEPFTLDGEHFQVHGARIEPPPAQQPRVPILIAGAGERVTLRQVAAFANASNFGPNPHTGAVFGVEAARRKFAVLREQCARIGRPFGSILRTYWSPPVILAETGDELRQKTAAISADEHRFYGDQMTIGTPEEVIPHFQRLIDAGFQYFILHTRADLETARLLAERVLPALTPIADSRELVTPDPRLAPQLPATPETPVWPGRSAIRRGSAGRARARRRFQRGPAATVQSHLGRDRRR
jgi:alkanesulfonate monooxygenase SsuD/methylene tetrahydromethanopterin reductase-like flavin-dependent oxidoreductase (luciferase family)